MPLGTVTAILGISVLIKKQKTRETWSKKEFKEKGIREETRIYNLQHQSGNFEIEY